MFCILTIGGLDIHRNNRNNTHNNGVHQRIVFANNCAGININQCARDLIARLVCMCMVITSHQHHQHRHRHHRLRSHPTNLCWHRAAQPGGIMDHIYKYMSDLDRNAIIESNKCVSQLMDRTVIMYYTCLFRLLCCLVLFP